MNISSGNVVSQSMYPASARSRNLYFFMINVLNVEANEIHEKSFEVVVCKINVLRLNLFIQGRKQKHLHLH